MSRKAALFSGALLATGVAGRFGGLPDFGKQFDDLKFDGLVEKLGDAEYAPKLSFPFYSKEGGAKKDSGADNGSSSGGGDGGSSDGPAGASVVSFTKLIGLGDTLPFTNTDNSVDTINVVDSMREVIAINSVGGWAVTTIDSSPLQNLFVGNPARDPSASILILNDATRLPQFDRQSQASLNQASFDITDDGRVAWVSGGSSNPGGLVFGTQDSSILLLEEDSDLLVGTALAIQDFRDLHVDPAGEFIYVIIRSHGEEKYVQVDTTTGAQVEMLSLTDDFLIDAALNLVIVDGDLGAKYGSNFNNFLAQVEVQDASLTGDELDAIIVGTPLGSKSILELAGGKLVEGESVPEALGFVSPVDGSPFTGTWAGFDGGQQERQGINDNGQTIITGEVTTDGNDEFNFILLDDTVVYQEQVTCFETELFDCAFWENASFDTISTLDDYFIGAVLLNNNGDWAARISIAFTDDQADPTLADPTLTPALQALIDNGAREFDVVIVNGVFVFGTGQNVDGIGGLGAIQRGFAMTDRYDECFVDLYTIIEVCETDVFGCENDDRQALSVTIDVCTGDSAGDGGDAEGEKKKTKPVDFKLDLGDLKDVFDFSKLADLQV